MEAVGNGVARAMCLTVRQPLADLLTSSAPGTEENAIFPAKSVHVVSRGTSYRGDVLVCSRPRPLASGRMTGVMHGLVELYDVKPAAEFTEEDWRRAALPDEARRRLQKSGRGCGLFFRNPRRVVEQPRYGRRGLHPVWIDRGEIAEYPRMVTLDSKGIDIARRRFL